MWDIVAATLIIAALSFGFFGWGFVIARRSSKAVSACLTLAAVAFVLWFAFAVRGRLVMASFLPFSNVIVLGNWIPLVAALLSGIIAAQDVIPLWRRLTLTGMIVSSAWYTNVVNLGGEAPRAYDLWSSRRVCLQTTTASCSACCAVMLLKRCGIPADEQEMIKLCLTTRKGTPTLGLYRGLLMKTKTAGADWKVQVVRCGVEELRRDKSGPVLLLVSLDRNKDSVEEILRQWLGAPATDHAVVLYRFTEDGKAIIGDPAGGVEPGGGRYIWTLDCLRERWGGEGLRLVPRHKKADAA